MGRRWWLALAFGGACVVTAWLAYFDANLDWPVEGGGAIHVVLWPVNLLLWVIGPGVPLQGGGYEWTPAQDFAVWIGTGLSWAFWVMTARAVWSRVNSIR